MDMSDCCRWAKVYMLAYPMVGGHRGRRGSDAVTSAGWVRRGIVSSWLWPMYRVLSCVTWTNHAAFNVFRRLLIRDNIICWFSSSKKSSGIVSSWLIARPRSANCVNGLNPAALAVVRPLPYRYSLVSWSSPLNVSFRAYCKWYAASVGYPRDMRTPLV